MLLFGMGVVGGDKVNTGSMTRLKKLDKMESYREDKKNSQKEICE